MPFQEPSNRGLTVSVTSRSPLGEHLKIDVEAAEHERSCIGVQHLPEEAEAQQEQREPCRDGPCGRLALKILPTRRITLELDSRWFALDAVAQLENCRPMNPNHLRDEVGGNLKALGIGRGPPRCSSDGRFGAHLRSDSGCLVIA